MMKKNYYLLIGVIAYLSSFPTTAQQVLMQGFYWDYPKYGQGYNWANTLSSQASELGSTGITHVWFPPFAGNGTKSGGYDPKDLYIGPSGSSATALGTKQDIQNMISTFTANNIKAVGDMVYNHRDGGNPENNSAVKEYMLFYAGRNDGSCPGTSYKQPFPSDRVRMTIPIGGSTGLGDGDYYFSVKSRSDGYSGYKYMFFVTTTKAGGGSAWDFVSGCSASSSAVTISTDIPTTGGAQVTNLKQGYWNTIDFNGDVDEFKVTLSSSNYNTTGDELVIMIINTCGSYSDHVISKIWYTGTNSDIASPSSPSGNWNTSNYKLQFQTYTDFTTMPSGQGASDWRSFRPNWNAYGASTAGGATTTCLGPAYSMQSLDYFYDYDHLQSSTQTTLIDWTKWAWSTLGVRGLRMDAIKHFEPEFVGTMLTSMYNDGKTPDLVVGEWYGEENPQIQNWVTSVNNGMSTAAKNAIKPKVFDFGLRYALKNACDNGADPRVAFRSGADGGRSLRDGRGMSGFNVVTFVNNHDMRNSNFSAENSLVNTDPILAYAYILTNNQIGVPTIFYPDYYGYPARNTNYGGDIISFDYHPTGLSPLKTQINQLIYVLKNYINGSTSVDYLNYAPSSPTNYITGSASRSLIYQLNANGSIGGKEVIVAINFGNTRLQVDHIIAVRNGIVQGTKFTDILQKSAFPTAVVDGSNRIYIDLPARSYSVWVQGTVSALPVELIDFQAVAQQEGIKLSWTTKSEKNVKSFEVQRSLDAQSFRTIATLSPQGTEGQGATYQYLDVDVPRNEVVYYRLKMNDLDGSVDYSRIKDVRIDDNRLQLSLSPNPTLGNTTLHLNSAEAMVIQIHLYDMAGRQVLHTEHTLRQGDNTFTLPTSQLSGGVYETIISDGVRKWGKRLVKQ
ncbi:MAG: alpha-amylase family glycosyl hydrolase [Spirosomataceae bacterium]